MIIDLCKRNEIEKLEFEAMKTVSESEKLSQIESIKLYASENKCWIVTSKRMTIYDKMEDKYWVFIIMTNQMQVLVLQHNIFYLNINRIILLAVLIWIYSYRIPFLFRQMFERIVSTLKPSVFLFWYGGTADQCVSNLSLFYTDL